MRRAPIVIVSTIAGTAAVLAYDPPEPEVPVALAAPAGGASSGSAAAGGSSASGSSTSGSPSGTAQDGTFLGDAVDTRYGPAQVQVTIAGGRITKVEAVQLQQDDPHSAQLSSSAAPRLAESALAKQSGDIDAVSGATITSASYEASLQSALDKAGFVAVGGARGSSEIPQVEEHGGRRGNAEGGEAWEQGGGAPWERGEAWEPGAGAPWERGDGTE